MRAKPLARVVARAVRRAQALGESLDVRGFSPFAVVRQGRLSGWDRGMMAGMSAVILGLLGMRALISLTRLMARMSPVGLRENL